MHHIRTAPYHPSSNGQVERAVQIFKDAMKKQSQETLQTRVSRFLFQYRNTPHTGCDTVLVRDFSHSKAKWLMGKIRYRSGPISFSVELDDGRVVRRHADHIRPHTATPKEYNYDHEDDYCQGPISEAQVGNERVPVVRWNLLLCVAPK